MKLIKIKEDHYVVVDDSEIKEGDYYFSKISDNVFRRSNGGHWIENYDKKMYQKITHSTQPLECDKMWTPVGGKQWMCNTMLCCGKILNPKTKPISLQEVKELIGEVDVEKKAEELTKHLTFPDERKEGIIIGYNQAIEDNKEKKYTEEDLKKAYFEGKSYVADTPPYFDNFEEFIQSLQPKTSWEVELVDGKLKLK